MQPAGSRRKITSFSRSRRLQPLPGQGLGPPIRARDLARRHQSQAELGVVGVGDLALSGLPQMAKRPSVVARVDDDVLVAKIEDDTPPT